MMEFKVSFWLYLVFILYQWSGINEDISMHMMENIQRREQNCFRALC